MISDFDWQLVETYGALYEAELAAGRLESAGIPARIDQRGGVGIFGPGHAGLTIHGVVLLVPATKLEEAIAALDVG